MKKQTKNFIEIAVVLFIAIILIGIFSEGTIRNLLNAFISWVCTSLGLTSFTPF